MLQENNGPPVHWVAAESLDAALQYMRKRYDDFVITEARFVDMGDSACYFGVAIRLFESFTNEAGIQPVMPYVSYRIFRSLSDNA